MSASPNDFTRLLNLASQGDSEASARVLPQVYDELRSLAAARLSRVPPGQTLQPTALVHEVWIRLSGKDDPGWEGRRHFFFAAARAMRDLLVEDARRKASAKRGGGQRRVEFEHAALAIEPPTDNLLDLDTVLVRLESLDVQGYRVVMLRYFAGLTMAETAEVLGVPLRTVERKWRFVRSWLRERLEPSA